MKSANHRVRIPPIHRLRPSWAATAQHAVIYLLRNSFLATLIAIAVVQPLYRICILESTLLQRLPAPVLFTFVFAWLCHCVPWFVFNSVYLLLDSVHPELGWSSYKQHPVLSFIGTWGAKYRIERRPQQLPTPALVIHTIKQSLFDQYIIVPMVLMALLFHFGTCESCCPPPETPIVGFSVYDTAAYLRGEQLGRMCGSFFVVMPHFLLANVVNEVGFYTAHGALHSSPMLYKLFHKKHHTYIGTIGIAAEYASPVEEMIANALPTIIYFTYMFFGYTRAEAAEVPFVMGARAWPLLMTWMWTRLWETYETHSGYCFTKSWLGRLGLMHGHRARFHDFHHTHNVSNYGAGIFMDATLNTMDPYLIFRYPTKHPVMITEENEEEQAHRDLMAASKAMHRVKEQS